MKRHLLFAFLLLIALVVSAVSLLPLLAGDCGASASNEPAIKACLIAQRRELSLFAIVWLATFANLIWQHIRDSRWLFPSYFAFVLLPVVSAGALATAQVKTWQSIDRAG